MSASHSKQEHTLRAIHGGDVALSQYLQTAWENLAEQIRNADVLNMNETGSPPRRQTRSTPPSSRTSLSLFHPLYPNLVIRRLSAVYLHPKGVD